MRFEGLTPDKGMFADFSNSKLVTDLKKAGEIYGKGEIN